MAGFKIEANKSDLSKITNKLTKLVSKLQSANGRLFKYRLKILSDYSDTVISVMGEVSAEGGSAYGDLFLGERLIVNWEPLSKSTVKMKQDFGYSLYIWEASGEAKASVTVIENEGFAGIPSDKTEAIEHALRAEFGTQEFPARPLFVLVNEIFKSNRQVILKEMQKQIMLTAREIGWGSS